MADRIKCPRCGRDKPAFAIVNGRCREDMRDEAHQTATRPPIGWNDIKAKRAILLERCDWTQVADVPLDAGTKAAWATYRQALRDLPETFATPGEVVWPTAPQ